MVELGYNYRIDEIRAALGRVQLGKLDANNVRRRALVHQYRCLLYTSDAADERSSVDLGGRRILKKKKEESTAQCQ